MRLPDEIETNARLRVQLAGVDKGKRRKLNFIGTGIVATDDPVNEKVDVNLSALTTPDTIWEQHTVAGNVRLDPLVEPADFYVHPTRDFDLAPARDFNLTAAGAINLTSTGYTEIDSDTFVMNSPNGIALTGVPFTVNSRGVPNVMHNYSTDVGNVTTGETDLYSDLVFYAANSERNEATFGGTFVSSVTASRRLRAYLGGTLIFDTGALTISAAAAWYMNLLTIRVSSSVVRYVVTMNTEFAALAAYTSVGEVTGLTLANGQTLKITGTAAGTGAATNDIVAKLGQVTFWPAV